MPTITVPAGIIGQRVQHLGTPSAIGTIESARVMDHATDPCHVELVVRWDSGERSRCGLKSVQTLPAFQTIRMVERANGSGYRAVSDAQFRRLTGIQFEGVDGDEEANTVTYWYCRKTEEE
jgi:molybdate-binding protein